MVETMRAEGYTALLNSAAGSNLGRILRRLCSAEGIELINVVRSEVQAQAIRSEGARHVCVSTAAEFVEELTACLRAAGPTLGFDAIGGGLLAGTLISAMDAAKRTMPSMPANASGPAKSTFTDLSILRPR
jgi:NADPH:quinone reductase-like Zn-dependent oxidoreductase